MAKKITPAQFLEKVMIPYNEGWGYIWGGAGAIWTQEDQDKATREQTVKYGQKWVGKHVVDCSGLPYWAFKKYGISIPHGSNSQYKNSVAEKGELKSGMTIKPGCGVFKYDATLQNPYYHVGIYVGNGKVVEARGTYKGVIQSDLFGWSHYGYWKNIDWTASDGSGSTEGDTTPSTAHDPGVYVVDVPNDGTVNVRKTVNGAKIDTLREGEKVTILNDDGTWSQVEYRKTISGYVMSKFLVSTDTPGMCVVDVPNDGTLRVRSKPNGNVLTTIREGDTVLVISDDGTWSQIEKSGENAEKKAGFIMSQFLKSST